MDDRVRAPACSRREWLTGALGLASVGAAPFAQAHAEAEQTTVRRIARIIGANPTISNRIRLFMPQVFPNGYTVPLAVDVDDGMPGPDHATSVRVFAPMNPTVEVAAFHFAPGRALPRVSTRVRLAEPQFVAAVAAMSTGAMLMARTWVSVETNGCQ